MPIKFSELETKSYNEATKIVALYRDSNGSNKNCIIDKESINNSIDTNVKNVLNLVYPIGSIYLSVTDTNPLQILGIGMWEKVGSDRVLQGSGSIGSADNTIEAGLPSIKHKHLIINTDNGNDRYEKVFIYENGNHTHTKGTMRIVGEAGNYGNGTGGNRIQSGAMYVKDHSGVPGESEATQGVSNIYGIDTNRGGWTGSTSSNGNHRHAINGETTSFDPISTKDANGNTNIFYDSKTLYGKSNTVQPNAYVVNIWKRIK